MDQSPKSRTIDGQDPLGWVAQWGRCSSVCGTHTVSQSQHTVAHCVNTTSTYNKLHNSMAINDVKEAKV